MKGILQRLRELTRAGLQWSGTAIARAGAGLKTAWTRAPELRPAAQRWARKAAQGVRLAWTAHLDSWAKTFSTGGFKPLPADWAGNLVAIGLVTALVVTSLVYGEDYQRRLFAARAIASGEHPSQQGALPPEEPPQPETPEPVPDVSTPEASPLPAPAVSLPQTGEAFVDRFDGSELDARWFVSDGWTNGDWMDNDWRKDQVSVGADGLALTMDHAQEGSKLKLSSGEIRTHAHYRYGYFEIRMKVPRDPGLITGAFSYAHQEGKTRPNEIDIEILGRDTRVLEATIHENGKSTHSKVRLPFDSADGFHTYGFDWQPNYVRWYADGKMIFEQKGGAAARLVRPQQFIINLWGSSKLTDWVGPLKHSRAPWKLEIACVAYDPTYAGRTICN